MTADQPRDAAIAAGPDAREAFIRRIVALTPGNFTDDFLFLLDRLDEARAAMTTPREDAIAALLELADTLDRDGDPVAETIRESVAAITTATLEPHLVPDIEALSDGERDCVVVLKWWQDFAISQGARAERAEDAVAAAFQRGRDTGVVEGGVDRAAIEAIPRYVTPDGEETYVEWAALRAALAAPAVPEPDDETYNNMAPRANAKTCGHGPDVTHPGCPVCHGLSAPADPTADLRAALPGHPSPNRGSGPWVLRLVCCGYDDGIERYATWDEADMFRQTYVTGPGGHDRAAILTRDLDTTYHRISAALAPSSDAPERPA